jgi:type I restriction enzyme S subunit
MGDKGYIRGPFGSALKRAELKESGIPVYEQQHAIDGVRTFRYFIDNDKYSELRRFTVEPNDLIISCSGTVGRISVIQAHDPRGIISQALLILRPDVEKVLPYYLYYFLTSKAGAQELVNASHGAVQLNIAPRNIVEKIPVPLPADIEIQRQIVRQLKTVDDKINLNRRINQTLEAVAQTIFKSWFVDFDPVKAKIAAIQEGRDPLRAAMTAISGKPDAELDALPPEQYDPLAATAAMFPDEMEESALGEIPKGWAVRAMSDCIVVNPSRSLKKGTVAQYLDMANVPTNSARAQNVVPREFTSGSKFRNGDTLLARITPCLENGKTAFVDFLNGDEVGWGSTEFIVLRPKNGLPEHFAYFLCRNPGFRAFAIAQMAGTSGRQRVPQDCFGGYKLVEPAGLVAIVFGRLAGAALNQIKALDEEARTLASLRDTILPKLLSGELSVTEAMAEAEA